MVTHTEDGRTLFMMKTLKMVELLLLYVFKRTNQNKTKVVEM